MIKKLLYLAMALALVACGKEPGNGGNDNQPKEVQCNLKGYAQKGQFVKGSQVTAFAVGADMVATGESFPANISDDLGSFAITGKTEAPYLELRAEGYYFNEVTGSVSTSPMYLEAFVKSNDSAANINLLTTIIRPRVKKLIAAGATYDKAVEQAQNELLSSKYVADMGFSGSVSAFDALDITGQSDADGILLAVACRILNQRSAAQVTTLVQELASELEADGKISYVEMVNPGLEVQPFAVMQNLADYYAEKKLSVTTIPPFQKYFGEQYRKPFAIVEYGYVDSFNPVRPTPDAVGRTYNIIATEDFTVESNIADAVIEKKHIIGPAYYVTCNIPANEGVDDRNYSIIFKDASGKELDRREGIQGGNVQYLILQFGSPTKSGIIIEDGSEENLIKEGAEISVNGQTFTLHAMDMAYGSLGVAVPKAEEYRVCCPANTFESAGHIAKVKATLPAVNNGKAVSPLYGALRSYQGMSIGNPAQVNMTVPLVKFRFTVAAGFENGWSHVDFTPLAENEYLAGTASFVANEGDKYLFPDLNSDIVFESDKQRTIRVNNTQTLEHYAFLTFPQTLSNGLKITVYGKNNEVLISKELSGERSLRAGQMIMIGGIKW